MSIHPTSRRRLTAILVAVGVTATAAAVASSATPRELPTSNLNTPAGKLSTLEAGVSYQAGAFPLALRLAAPDAAWGGAQWRTSSHGKPAFGWAGVGHAPLAKPLGAVEIETAFGPTPSVGVTIARLRIGGSHPPESNVGGTSWEDPRPVRLAGYSGREFDGKVWGIYGHVFVPFTPQTHGASPPDSLRLEKGEAFRVIVLNVRGKTVVFFLESFALPADQFPAFLDSAAKILQTLRFPSR
jgi:hypothetical protein